MGHTFRRNNSKRAMKRKDSDRIENQDCVDSTQPTTPMINRTNGNHQIIVNLSNNNEDEPITFGPEFFRDVWWGPDLLRPLLIILLLCFGVVTDLKLVISYWSLDERWEAYATMAFVGISWLARIFACLIWKIHLGSLRGVSTLPKIVNKSWSLWTVRMGLVLLGLGHILVHWDIFKCQLHFLRTNRSHGRKQLDEDQFRKIYLAARRAEIFSWMQIMLLSTPQRLVQISIIAWDWFLNYDLPHPLQLASLAVALVSRVWFYFSVNHGREWLKDEQTTMDLVLRIVTGFLSRSLFMINRVFSLILFGLTYPYYMTTLITYNIIVTNAIAYGFTIQTIVNEYTGFNIFKVLPYGKKVSQKALNFFTYFILIIYTFENTFINVQWEFTVPINGTSANNTNIENVLLKQHHVISGWIFKNALIVHIVINVVAFALKLAYDILQFKYVKSMEKKLEAFHIYISQQKELVEARELLFPHFPYPVLEIFP